jgi:hypothetical protein
MSVENETIEIPSSSPVAHELLATKGQWAVIVGHAFDGGLFIVGPFPSQEKADEWSDEGHDGVSVPILDPEATCVDRCGYPLHQKDAFRS